MFTTNINLVPLGSALFPSAPLVSRHFSSPPLVSSPRPSTPFRTFLQVLASRAVLGLDVIHSAVTQGMAYLPVVLPENPADGAIQAIFIATYSLILVRVMLLDASKFSDTRNKLVLVLLYRLIPVGSLLGDFGEVEMIDIISNGLFTSLITADIVSSRFANRQLHPWVVVLAMCSVMNNILNILLVIAYFICVCVEMCSYTSMPLLAINRNVYCDGIYDMCHVGHMKAFKNAASKGTRLFVGVCGDEEATPYKRPPIMNEKERAEVVARCKYVYKVIEHAPCTKGALNEEFILKHNIHVVVCGEEYMVEGDEWYAAPRRMGMLTSSPRTEGISTSDLIKRIQQRGEGGKEVKAASD